MRKLTHLFVEIPLGEAFYFSTKSRKDHTAILEKEKHPNRLALHENTVTFIVGAKKMEVYCASIERAVDSWKIVQQDPNYYLTFGEALFQRYA